MSDKSCVTEMFLRIFTRTEVLDVINYVSLSVMSPICLETSPKKKKRDRLEYLFEILKLKGLMQIPNFKNCIDMNEFRSMTSQFTTPVCTTQTQHGHSLLH
jgi:hypothetical protein